ncbi:MAG: transglutaminase family protein, partial [Bacteroidia bacterium]|nr:transglutaminase family protein [Bacteroidia bacterium]
MKLLNNMKKYQLFRSISLLCLITPLLIIAFKWIKNPNTFQHLYPGHIYTVTYEFDLSKLDKDVFVKAFLPRSNERQDIKDQTLHGNSYSFSKETNEFGDRGIWKVKDTRDIIISHQFKVESQSLKYELPDSMSYEFHYPSDIKQYLQPSDFIQSDHHLIDSIAKQLKGTELRSTLNSNFEFVKQITNSHTGILTDAITVLERQRASCNGKSRLFVALCRA